MYIRYYVVRNIGAVLVVGGLISWAVVASGPTSSSPRALTTPVTPPPSPTSRRLLPSPSPTPRQPAPTQRPGVATPAPVAQPTRANRAATRPWVSVFTQASSNARSSKAKDVFRGTGPKLNLYDDDADGRYDRGKVDWNRDDSWDSRLTLKDGVWEVRERGTVRIWDAGAKRLVAKGAASITARPTTKLPPASPSTLSVSVQLPAAFAAAGQRMRDGRASGKKAKDAMRSTGAKVNLYDDNRDGAWDRAKVDHDRDGTWDGKLTRKKGAIELKASGKVFRLEGTAWVPKGTTK